LMLEKNQSPPAGQVPVSAYGGSSKNLKDLKDLKTGVRGSTERPPQPRHSAKHRVGRRPDKHGAAHHVKFGLPRSQVVLVRGHAGLVINKLSTFHLWVEAQGRPHNS
jgi:hypothetical protein